MKPARFRYHAPKTIEEAVDTLAEVAGEIAACVVELYALAGLS